MYIYRVEKDGETFYVQASDLQDYYNNDYELYGFNTSSGGGDVSPQGESSEYEITSDNIAAQIAAGIAEATGSA